jgi:glycosyltransferase involved in cell wall biosynthesis
MPSKIAAIIPCYNEELTVSKVVKDLKSNIPEAVIYVFDNNSTDSTASEAKAAGAEVIKERKQGKGFVMQSMFSKIDADVYVMVDGDDTYDLSLLRSMIMMVEAGEADMIVGNRLKTYTEKSFRRFHTCGNQLVKSLVNILFRSKLKDIMSGFRVMSKSFVKNTNIMAAGFEVETEMTIKALKNKYLIREIDINYKERPEGSFSKLNTFSDGFRVLKTIFLIFKDYKPLLFFSILALITFVFSFSAALIVIVEFIRTKYITHVPLAILASGTMIFSLVLLAIGIILDAINKRFDELTNFIKNKN